MPSISPTSAGISINGSQALVSTDVPSPKWYIVSGLGSLSGVSGSNATYDAPSTPTVAKVRAAESYWNITYDPNSRLTVDGSNVLNLASAGPGYANGKQTILVAGCGFKWTVPTGYPHVSDTNHLVGVTEGATGAQYNLSRTGVLTGGINVGVADGDVFEWILSGTRSILVKKNGTLVHTYSNVASWDFGVYAPGAWKFHVRNINFSGGATLSVPPALEVGAKSNFLDWICVESEITVTAPLDASFSLGAPSYNYGQSVSVNATSTGGVGDKENVWRIDSVIVAPSNGDYVNPTFAGLSAGYHEIEIEVTDDTETDTFSSSVFIGTVSGSSSLLENQTSSYTTNVNTPIWTKVSGEGSINSSTGALTTPSGTGEIVIKATKTGDATEFATKTIIYGFPRRYTAGDVTQINATGLIPGRNYRARYRAKDGTNTSEWSDYGTGSTS